MGIELLSKRGKGRRNYSLSQTYKPSQTIHTIMKRFLLICFSVSLITSCNIINDPQITNKNDYNAYLSTGPVKTTSKYFTLWDSKIKPDSLQLTSFGVVAGQYNLYFNQSGDIEYLKKAEKALKKAVDIAAIGRSGFLRALARNYISQHRFKEALILAEEARAMGSGALESQYLLFDLHMELGNYQLAEQYLDSTKNMSEFGYLIRLAKWNDHQGNLDVTIRLMEKAMAKAEQANNRTMKLWSYTNLGDYYGHAGRIKDAYSQYLKALSIDPFNAYAKKGIAWIAYSHEKNPKEALRILDSITRNYESPDIYLLKAEIAEFTDNGLAYKENMEKYFTSVENPKYGDMYNAYSIDLYLNSTLKYEKAIALAAKEVENRPTTTSYDLLAYSYFKAGEKEKAYKIVLEHVLGKSQEPTVLLHVAEILKERGDLVLVKNIRQSLEEAAYELGPVTSKKVQAL
jgi:tetratricopeptide (TPR) repeat protein